MKKEMSVLQAHNLRGLIDAVNRINENSDHPILREDIIEIRKEDETFFLLYFK